MSWFALIPPQTRFWIYIALFTVWVGSYVYVFHKGAAWKEARMEAKTIVKTITIREKQNEVRDNRPSVNRTIDRMRNNTF